jgi:pyruvate/2-oxoglutarate/acetoin dehydrogenase E1 component
VFTQLSPFWINPILDSVNLTNKLLVVEEGTKTLGWGAEIIARITEIMGPELRSAARLAAKDLPIPASIPLEEMVLPGVDDIIRSIKKMV